MPYFDVNDITGRLGELVRSRAPLNLYRILPNAPEAAIGLLTLGSAVLTKLALPPTLRELAILRVGALCNASYEIHQHRQVARAAGLPQAKIETALRPGSTEALEPHEALVIAFTDAVVRDVKAPEALYASVAQALGDQQTMELLVTIGYYMLVSRLLENLEVDLENPPLEHVEMPRA
ncbi:carboxymuconolactone decarboxylase family protein [Cupriavidus sp. NPDC089707]|uniref:carboxymuconolactone decarboxylase family protein n=1 Tax=Cupriavidus sp. NPDC089707 TaxID=3363963 RepID=UPI003825C176